MDKLESCFYIDFHNYDVTTLTEKQRKDCVRQGSQLKDQIVAGKMTPTIKFFNYWKKDHIFDIDLGRAILKHNNEEEDGVMEDGVLVVKIKELDVYNEFDGETQTYDEHTIQTLLKQKEDLREKLSELRRGAGITDYDVLKEKYTNLNRRHTHINKIYKTKCEEYNKMTIKGKGKGAAEALIKEIAEHKRKLEWYFQHYGAVKSEFDN
jgi:hypothetical protein